MPPPAASLALQPAPLLTRRRFVASAPWWAAAPLVLTGCAREPAEDSHELVAARIRRSPEVAGVATGSAPGVLGAALGRELVRCATLAPSSHNTQCWTFALQDRGVTILPDLSRRCPVVDPDDHHLFVSLGCATENLVHAALAHGLHAQADYDDTRAAVVVALAPTPAQPSALFQAMASRQCTRGDYDGRPLSSGELALLERAGTSKGVRMLVLTETAAVERVLDHVLQGNAAQIADPAFVRELKRWIRFNGKDAVRTGDGLFSACSGNPSIPTWVGDLAFGWFFTAQGENDKIARQVRNSAGLAVFVGEQDDRAHWVEVGRAYERFALQATALGIRNAFLNQAVEVAAVRSPFAAALGLAGRRPDLVVRFGRGPTLPSSLRRPVEAVLA